MPRKKISNTVKSPAKLNYYQKSAKGHRKFETQEQLKKSRDLSNDNILCK